jgi:hypothetical protein
MAKEDPKKVAQDIEDSFSSLRETLKSIGEELGVNINKITEAKKEYRSLLDIAKQLQNNEEEIVKLSDRQVKTLRSKAESSLRDLKVTAQKLAQEKGIVDISKTNLKFRKDLTDEQFSLLSALQDNFSVETQIVNELGKEDDLRDSINKKTGILGGILKGISKIPILGNVFDAEQALDASRDKIRETNSSLAGLGAAFKNIGKQVTEGLFNTSNLALGVFTLITKTLFELDSNAGEFAKSMNVTYTEALNTRKEMSNLALSTGDAALHSADLMKTQEAVGQALGTNAKLNKEDLVTMTKLTHQAGYTHEELMGVQKLSLINGKSLKDNTSTILGGAKAYASRNKLVVNEKQILKDISKASASLQLSLGGSADELARSAVQARQFGINLEQAEKMSQSLLDFESSIENELSAELITGRDLNLERARGLALNGDAAAAAAEIASQVGSAADFGKMNVIQQEAIAKAIGMQRDELAQSLIDKEALAKLGAEEGQTALQAYQAKREAGMSEAEIAQQLGDEQLARQYEQQSIQEQFNDTMLQLKETLINGILPAFTTIGNFISEHLGLIKTIVGVYIGLKAAQMGFIAAQRISMLLGKQQKAMTMSMAVAEIIKGNWASVGITPFVGAALAVAGIAAGIGTLYAMTANDMMSAPPGYGQRTLLGPEGAIQLNDKDTVIAGTNLFGNDVKSEPGKATEMAGKGAIKVQAAGGGNDMSAVISAINALANRPINVSIDGKKVIEATTGANPNTAGDENRKNSYKMS